MLVTRGYESTRYADVAEASGVPVASLQHYFPTVEVLRREALRHKVRVELEILAAEVAHEVDPWQQVQRIIISSISQDPVRRRGGWVLWLEYWRAAAHDPALAEDSREVDRIWLDLAARCIEAGSAAGRFQIEVTPWAAAVELHALIDGLGIGLTIEHPPAQAEAAIAMVEAAARRMLLPSRR